jgi:N-acyl-D-aspartate/D-glutamate deacylase
MRLLVTLLAAGLASCSTTTESYDVLIVNGLVYDGSLRPAVQTNIGIRGHRIVSINASDDATAAAVIDANGKLVAPGFIDPHTHALRNLRDPASKTNLNYLLQGVTTVFIGSDGAGVVDRAPTLALLEAQGIGPNVAFFAGHGAVRKTAMGMADRIPNEEELQTMRNLVENEMRAGAIGFSSGLFYAPGSYSETSEVIELAKVAAAFGGVYDSHIRSESSHADGLIAAVKEAIRIGNDANLPVHISHIKALGQDVWGMSNAIVALLNEAREAGVSVSANQYPWSASGTRFSNALIPRWVMADSKARMSERLSDPELRPRILEEMQINLELRGGAAAMLVTNATSDFVGMNLAEISVLLETNVLDAAIQVVLGGDPSIASFVMAQGDIDTFALQPWVVTGSDGSAGHPRLYGTYPKVWKDFVINRELLSVQQFVHRNSGLVADTFSLCERGYLLPGFVADIVVIDPDRYAPQASYKHPTELATGVDQVLINGVLVVDNTHTAKLSGQVLKMTACN